MLILRRKVRESIQIGPDILLTVMKIEGSSVKLGIQAPPEMAIIRPDSVDDPAAPQPAGTAHKPA